MDDMKMVLYNTEPIHPSTIISEWVAGSEILMDIVDKQLIDTGITNISDKFCEPSECNVLCKYFTEKYQNPNIYYTHKIELTKSMAAWSVSGELLGLGDRHMGNILIISSNSKILHIDLAYIMNLARYSLKVPEHVLFRFTYNFRNWLGLFEGNGLFFYYCVSVRKAFSKYSYYIYSKFLGFIYAEGVMEFIKSKAASVKNGLEIDPYKHVDHVIKTSASEKTLKDMYKGWGWWK
jgi:phosphatidylinositol kinase/protein kinase (PI-3  family)